MVSAMWCEPPHSASETIACAAWVEAAPEGAVGPESLAGVDDQNPHHTLYQNFAWVDSFFG